MCSETHRRATDAGAAEADGNAGAGTPRCGVAVRRHAPVRSCGVRPGRDGEGGGDLHASPFPRGVGAERDWLQPSAPREGIATTIGVTCRWAMPPSLSITTHAAIPARILRSTTRGRLYLQNTLLQRLAQDLHDGAPEPRQFIETEHAVVRQRHFAWQVDLAAADSPGVRDRMVRGAKRARGDDGGTVPMRPATRWMRVVSRASARLIAGRMGVSRRASLDCATPDGPSSRT